MNRKFKVLYIYSDLECWDSIDDPVDAENEDEAIELSKEFMKNEAINIGNDPSEIQDYLFRAFEIFD